jgi:hypothetical protein
MDTAFVLVKNLTSDSSELIFSEFKIYEIQYGDTDALERAHKLFSVGIPLYGDWVYERSYKNITNHTERILYDIEDTLFLLRLFKTGDVVFVRPCIKEQNGNLLRQLPYRVMSDIHAFEEYELQTTECFQFDEFTAKIKSQKNWSSTWFKTARRFFLYGSSKEFNPTHNEVDRIVDYMIAIESILIPESDFIGRRLRERAASLLKNRDFNENETKLILNNFYKIRSKIVHGDNISSNTETLERINVIRFEEIIRKVISQSIQILPENDKNRNEFLKGLFDISDDDRADKVINDFGAIKNKYKKKKVFD